MLEKKYNHLEVEKGKYEYWLKNDYFKAGTDKSKKPFCIVIPPPNVTGKKKIKALSIILNIILKEQINI